MALVKKHVYAPLAVGVDAGGTDPQSVNGKNIKLENVTFPRRGVIAKRAGTRTHTTPSFTSSTLTWGPGEVKGAPIWGGDVQGPHVWHGSAPSDDSWHQQSSGTEYSVIDAQANYVGMVDDFYFTQCSKNSTYFVAIGTTFDGSNADHTWKTFYVNGFAEVNGSTLSATTTSSDLPGRTFSTANGTLGAVWIDSSDIKYATVKSDGTWNTTVILDTGSTPSLPLNPTSLHLDVCSLTGDNIAIAYEDSSNQVVVYVLDVVAGTSGGSLTETTGTTPLCLAVHQTSPTDEFVVSWANASDFYFDQGDDTGTRSVPAVLSFGGAISNVTHCTSAYIGTVGSNPTHRVVYQTKASNARPQAYVTGCSNELGALVLTAPAISVTGRTIVGGLFAADDSNIYLAEYHQGAGWWKSSVPTIDKATTQRTYQFTRYSNTVGSNGLTIVGQALPGFAGHSLASIPSPTKTHFDHTSISRIESDPDGGQTKFYVPLLKRVGEKKSAIVIYEVDSAYGKVESNSIGSQILYTGSIPIKHDGQRLVPQTVPEWPEGVTVADAGGAGGTWSTTGDVGFSVVYEYYDESGRVIRSIPSPVVSYTLGATTEEPQLTIPAPLMEVASFGGSGGDYYRPANVRVAVYMTGINGNIFYLQESLNYTSGDTLTSTAVLTEGDQTSTSGNNIVPLVPVLYTRGGVLETSPAKPHRHAAVYQNRYFIVDRDNESDTIYYSRQMNDIESVPHSDFLQIKVGSDGGAITALYAFEEKLFIFKSDRVYVTSGQGNGADGSGPGYARPRLVSKSVGCINSLSIVETPAGLIFQGREGFYAMRGEQLQLIGHGVRYYTDTYSVRSGVLHTPENIAIWTTTDGPSIVYNYLYEAWSVWSDEFDSCRDISSVNNKLFFSKTANADLHAYDPSVYTDSSTAYSSTIETQWYNLNDVLGEFKLYRTILLGYNITDSNIQIQHQYDFDPHWHPSTITDTQLDLSTVSQFDYTSFMGAGEDSTYIAGAMMLQVKGPRQKVKSVRFRITDADSTAGTTPRGQGFELTGLVFVVGQRPQAALIGDKRKLT